MFAIDVCSGGHILFDGPRFYPKPNSSVTMTVWIKLEKIVSRQAVFTTIGGEASCHSCPHYVFEIKDSRVRWFHRNERKVTIFSVLTKPLINKETWMHLAVTYDGVLGIAKVRKRDIFSFSYYSFNSSSYFCLSLVQYPNSFTYFQFFDI